MMTLPEDDIRLRGVNERILWDSDYARVVSSLIAGAKKKIYVTSFKMDTSKRPRAQRLNRLVSLLVAAQRRGVVVRVLLNFIQNKTGTSGINWYAAKKLAEQGIEVRYVPGDRVFHAKVVLVDGVDCVIGSHNWSVSSQDKNIELSVSISSNMMCAGLEFMLDQFWSQAVSFPPGREEREAKKGG